MSNNMGSGTVGANRNGFDIPGTGFSGSDTRSSEPAVLGAGVILDNIRRCNLNLLLVNGIALVALTPLLANLFHSDGDGYSASTRNLVLELGLLGLLLSNLARAAFRMSDVRRSPIYRRLTRFNAPPAEMAARIEEQVKESGGMARGRCVLVTESWLLDKGRFHLDVTHLHEIIWIYRRVTRRRVNGIPVGTSHDVLVFDKHGRKIELFLGSGPNAANAAIFILNKILNQVPWVIAGPSPDTKRMYKKHRAELVETVNTNRANYYAQRMAT
jgi:hypothetical protein